MTKKLLDKAAMKRLRAGPMLLAGKRPAEVALAVSVARQTMTRGSGCWMKPAPRLYAPFLVRER